MPVLECSRCNELFYSASGINSEQCENCGGTVWRVFDDEASFDRVAARPRQSQPGDHLAIVYSDPQEAADFCARYVREGLGRGELVMAVLPETLERALEQRLSARERGQLQMAPAVTAYTDFNPHTLITWYEAVPRYFMWARDVHGAARPRKAQWVALTSLEALIRSDGKPP